MRLFLSFSKRTVYGAGVSKFFSGNGVLMHAKGAELRLPKVHLQVSVRPHTGSVQKPVGERHARPGDA